MLVSTTLEFSMGHRLLGYEGLCGYLHGHNYEVTVEVVGNPDNMGLVLDFSVLRETVKILIQPLDHAMLLVNTDPAVESLMALHERVATFSVNPSAENIASWFFNKLVDAQVKVQTVRVRETKNSIAIATATDRRVKLLRAL